jgi:hypothetical protein
MAAMLRLKDGLTIQPLPGGDAVVAAGQGATAVIVNTAAHAILDLLDAERSEEEIAEVFCQSFPDRDPAELRRDVAQLVGELLRAGIVEPCGDAPSTA